MHILIVGGGKVGSLLARLLTQTGHSITIVETRRDRQVNLSQELPTARVLAGDGSSPRILREAEAYQADAAVAATGEDESNLVISLLARREFKVPLVVARINNPRNAHLFTKQMGVDVAVDQAGIIARLVQEEVTLGEMVTLLKMRRGELTLVEQMLAADSSAAGKKVSELMLIKEIVLVAVFRKGEVLLPRGDTVLEANDEILALVKDGYEGHLKGKLK
ncbi:MAG TPA: potassium transporter TrkA [Syntrophobacteraceae bacterium]|jgi:trk system potassium uptake protein|nr:potassium transporter TrkA [Syntrophobacteraceae bacterium]